MNNKMEAVQILERRFNYFPMRFRWRGQQFEVVHVEQVRSTRREWPRRTQRRVYLVRTIEGHFALSHDLLHDIWYIRSAPTQLRDMWRPRVLHVSQKMRSVAYGDRFVVVR